MGNNSGFTGNKNPTTTDWEEHGATGDISTGRRLKYTQDVPLKKIIREHSTDSTILYIGEAAFGVAETAPLWRVKRLVQSGENLDLTMSNGSDAFDQIFSDRESLSYS